MTTITSSWPFAQWGIDIVGPLPQRKRQVKFLLVAIDYFIRWVEAKALTTITKARIHKFTWKNIVCKFDILRAITSNNGRQFDSQGFRTFCLNLGIKNQFSSLGHPQANGQTKVTNRILLKIIKVRLEGTKCAWPNELPNDPTRETPFNLTYVTEAVIIVEVGVTSIRRRFFDEEGNDDQLKMNLDCLDEVRTEAS